MSIPGNKPQNIPGWVTIHSIVDNVANAMNIYDGSEDFRLMQLAIRGLKRINILTPVNNIEAVELTLNDVGQVEIPDDFISEIKVWTGTPPMIIPWSDAIKIGSSNVQAGAIQTYSSIPTAPYYSNTGEYVGTSYGTPDTNGCYARVNKKDRVLQVDGLVTGTVVVLEYNSTGIRIDGKTLVPVEAEEALIAFVHWQRVEYDVTLPVAERLNVGAKYARRFGEEYKNLKSMNSKFSAQKLRNLLAGISTQGPRR